MPRDPRQREVWFVDLDPTVGDEIRKTRPCLILSRDEINRGGDGRRVLIVAPMSTTQRTGSIRVPIPGEGGEPDRASYVMPWQVRAISHDRLTGQPVATVDRDTFQRVVKYLTILIALPSN